MVLRVRHLTCFRKISREHGRITKGVLKGLSDTNPSGIGPRKPGPKYVTIFTLDPNKLVEKNQQRLHIGYHAYFIPHISLNKQLSTVAGPRLDYEAYNQIMGSNDMRYRKCLPYPPDTNAFLYYSTPRDKPRIAGELRLRLTSSGDPASFESGSDLLGTNGQPWSRPLPYLPRYYLPLYEKLREEGLVSDGLDRILSTLPSKFPSYRGRHRLYTLNDPFIIDFSSKGLYFYVITEKGIEAMLWFKTFTDRREMCTGVPYTGSALARFERSTLLEHEGTRTVVLRFLKIITPMKCVVPLYDGHICCPKEGEFYKKKSGPKGCQKAWSVNIDKTKGRSSITKGLQLLWDA